jgi:phage recombination protein Bet
MSADLIIFEKLLSKESGAVKMFEQNYVQSFAQKYLALKVPASDILSFFHKAQITGANPVMEEIYLIPRQTKINEQFVTVGTIVFSYHYVEQMAQKSKQYQGFKIVTSVKDKLDVLSGEMKKVLSSVCIVNRSGFEYSFEAWFDEYAQYGKYGLQGSWKTKPYLMLEKCAKAGALRSAFPEWLTGVYSQEEMSQVERDQDEWIERNTFETIQVNKKKKDDEKKKAEAEDMGEVEKYYNDCLKEMTRITKGCTKEQKTAAQFELAGVRNFIDLKKKSLADIQSVLEKLINTKEINETQKAISEVLK